MAQTQTPITVVLAGDIGGTHLRLALFAPHAILTQPPLFTRTWKTHAFISLAQALQRFLSEALVVYPNLTIDWVGIGIPGQPASSVQVTAVNLPWQVTQPMLQQWFAKHHTQKHPHPLKRCILLNDFVALAHALPALSPAHVCPLSLSGKPPRQQPARLEKPTQPMALLGAGTGLGAAFIQPYPPPSNGIGWLYTPSELGATDFAPRNPQEDALLVWLRTQTETRQKRVSWEMLLSGFGLALLQRFLSQQSAVSSNRGIVSTTVLDNDQPMDSACKDTAALIVEKALAQSDLGCVEAVRWFCRLYAAAAANWALRVLPWGGVFLAGGITTRLLPFLQAGEFRQVFEAHPYHYTILRAIPTWVISHPDPGLAGAALAAMAPYSQTVQF